MRALYKFLIIGAFAISFTEGTPVSDIGALSTAGTQVVGANGSPAQLRGMSLFWNIAQEGGPYWNANVVDWLAEDWHANLVRASMAVEDSWGTDATLASGAYKGYLYDASWNQKMVETVVDAAIAKGIYVIIDWHSTWTTDNSNGKQDAAVTFFTAMATKYGTYPNVIYEIYNEPGGDDWSAIKTYAEKIIPVIRAIDPDNLILVGTPSYSSRVDIAAADPLTGSNATNIAYSFHFYASEQWHYDNYMTYANTAMNSIPLFVSEWGLSQASGDGTINTSYVETFFNWMESKKLCWSAWSISKKNESSAALYTTASTSGNWSNSDLRQSGTYLREKLRALNPEYTSSIPRHASRNAMLGVTLQGSSLAVTAAGAGVLSAELLDLSGRSVKKLYRGNTAGGLRLSLAGFHGVYLVRVRQGAEQILKTIAIQ